MSEASNINEPLRIRSLHPDDAAALDALIEARSSEAVVSYTGHDPRRQEKLAQVTRLLDVLPDDEQTDVEAEALVQATLANVSHVHQRERFASQVQMLAGSTGGGGLGWQQVASIAAAVVIAASLLLPVLSRNRAEARRLACQANLATAGQGFHQYAADFGGVLPRRAVEPGTSWWNVGESSAGDGQPVHSNPAHLYVLVRSGYVPADQLACPGNAHAPIGRMSPDDHDWPSAQAVSYSYQNQFTREPVRIDHNGHLAVLADKNPLFVVRVGRVAFDSEMPRFAPSRIHNSRGQNVLMATGEVRWTVRPFVRHSSESQFDNIWVAEGVDRYTGTERPRDAFDSFLVP